MLIAENGRRYKRCELNNTAHKNITHHKGLSKNRQDDGTGRSIPLAAGGHIVALKTRRGGRRDSNYCQ